jgi:hypothetical protein
LDQNRVRSVSALQTGNKKTLAATGGCQKMLAVVAAMHWPKSAWAVGKSWAAMGVTNGERQIEIAGRGAGVIEDARAD